MPTLKMVTVKLLIKKELIEAIDVVVTGNTFEARQEQVNQASGWLQYKYRATINLLHNWEVVVDGVESGMNKTNKIEIAWK